MGTKNCDEMTLKQFVLFTGCILTIGFDIDKYCSSILKGKRLSTNFILFV